MSKLLQVLVAMGLCAADASAQSASRLYDRAATLEAQARRGGAGADKVGPTAVYVYEQAARSGSGKASRRLSEIYAAGLPGVQRDTAEAERWREDARSLGERLPESSQERIQREKAMEAVRESVTRPLQRSK